MKKALTLGIVMVLSLFVVGCEKTIELTDEENYLIAEYAADLLIKYDNNLDSKYYGLDFQSPHEIELATPADATESEPTTEAQAPTTEAAPEEGTDSVPEMDSVSEVNADYNYSEFDLAEFLGVENVSAKYQHYMLTDMYPAYDHDGMYIEVQAPEGYKLLVLRFKFDNKTNLAQIVNLYEKDVDYRIIVNNRKSAKHMLTILMDDLYTYDATIEASGIDEAVLLFQVSDSVAQDITDLKLKTEYAGKKAVVQLK